MPNADPIKTDRLEMKVSSSSGKPVGAIQSAAMEKPAPMGLTGNWAWDIEEGPNVFGLCEDGLMVFKLIIHYLD